MLKLYENIKRKRLELGYSQTKLAELTGHASPEMTLRVYTNLSDDDICTDQVREIVNDLQSCKR